MSNRELADPISWMEIKLNEMFQRVFQNDEARTHLGFSQISQAPPDKGLPGWYLWFSDMKGAWHVGIICEDPVSSGKVHKDSLQPETVSTVGLVLRYFPDIEEKIFETFHVLSRYSEWVQISMLQARPRLKVRVPCTKVSTWLAI